MATHSAAQPGVQDAGNAETGLPGSRRESTPHTRGAAAEPTVPAAPGVTPEAAARTRGPARVWTYSSWHAVSTRSILAVLTLRKNPKEPWNRWRPSGKASGPSGSPQGRPHASWRHCACALHPPRSSPAPGPGAHPPHPWAAGWACSGACSEREALWSYSWHHRCGPYRTWPPDSSSALVWYLSVKGEEKCSACFSHTHT